MQSDSPTPDWQAQAEKSAREFVAKLIERLVDDASDSEIEHRFGSRPAQAVLFAGMAYSFKPDAAQGFEGRIVYELRRPATEQPPRWWTIEVTGRRAHVQRGGAPDAKLTLHFNLADFMRIAAGKLDPAVPVLQGRATLEGDFGLATRLAQMFG